MNALDLARTAYSSNSAPIRSAQSTEYDAIARITHQISAAMSKGKPGFAHLVSALHDNRRLWILLAGSVADGDNALPQVLRAQVFYLAEFTMQHTGKVMDGSATADILVEINTAVMRGLRQREVAV